MNLSKLQSKLVAVARANPPGDQVPYAFEKRVMALLKARTMPQGLDLWVRGLWRAAASCVAITVVCGLWVALTPAISTSPTEDLSQDFQNTLLASVDPGDMAP